MSYFIAFMAGLAADLALAVYVVERAMPTGKTHHPGCWRERGHGECAVAEVERCHGAMEEATEMLGCETFSDTRARRLALAKLREARGGG